MKWAVVKYENGILTTQAGHRFQDFICDRERPLSGLVHVMKHFGDHEHDSGTDVEVQYVHDPVALLVNAALKFYGMYE